VIAPKIALEVDVEALRLGGEGAVVGRRLLLLGVSALACIVSHLLDGSVELALEHADSINGVPRDEASQNWVNSSQIVD